MFILFNYYSFRQHFLDFWIIATNAYLYSSTVRRRSLKSLTLSHAFNSPYLLFPWKIPNEIFWGATLPNFKNALLVSQISNRPRTTLLFLSEGRTYNIIYSEWRSSQIIQFFFWTKFCVLVNCSYWVYN